jgi:NAD(P)-dependent dehydrogenase (short-subunit alcohol dehydrogenase family)
MKRVVVLGGSGFFGRLIAEKLHRAELRPIVASRSQGDLRIDADNPTDIRSNLEPRDLVIDAAGPFQTRTPALIEAARTIGFDVIDLSDSPEYSSFIYDQAAPIQAAGIRVLTACSALSTVSALVLKSSGIDQPETLSAYLVPASRKTASLGTLTSVLASVEGERRTFRFPQPFGMRSGITARSVDKVTLPRLFSSLRTIELVIDLQVPGANTLLRAKSFRWMLSRFQPMVVNITHRIGHSTGVLAYEITSAGRHTQTIFSGEQSYLLAVIPAVEAAKAIVSGRFPQRGVIPATEHIDLTRFTDAVRREGIAMVGSLPE